MIGIDLNMLPIVEMCRASGLETTASCYGTGKKASGENHRVNDWPYLCLDPRNCTRKFSTLIIPLIKVQRKVESAYSGNVRYILEDGLECEISPPFDLFSVIYKRIGSDKEEHLSCLSSLLGSRWMDFDTLGIYMDLMLISSIEWPLDGRGREWLRGIKRGWSDALRRVILEGADIGRRRLC